jgi:hypothetical protein
LILLIYQVRLSYAAIAEGGRAILTCLEFAKTLPNGLLEMIAIN